MWIFDSYFKGCVTMWGREGGLARSSLPYPPSFYMHLKDPHAHGKMIETLESRFKAEECSFRTIYGTLQGYRIHADRKVAEKIEIQTHHQAELYNVDVRQDQRYLAEHDLFPCGDRDESRFSPDFQVPLTSLELQVAGDPSMPREISHIEVLDGCRRILQGPEQTVLSDLLDLIKSHDPDLILCPHADTWIRHQARPRPALDRLQHGENIFRQPPNWHILAKDEYLAIYGQQTFDEIFALLISFVSGFA